MTCSTCRNFRQGVVARVGFCAMDRTREPLNGDEIRACWQAPAVAETPAGLFATLEQGADEKPLGIVETARQLVEAELAADGEATAAGAAGPASGRAGIAPRSSGVRPGTAPAGSPAPDVASPLAAPRTYRPVTWISAASPPSPAGSDTAPAPSRAASRPPATKSEVPPPRPAGRLLEAPVVAPRLRLGSRGDARSARDAAGVPTLAVPSPSANGEGDRLLEGGPAL